MLQLSELLNISPLLDPGIEATGSESHKATSKSTRPLGILQPRENSWGNF